MYNYHVEQWQMSSKRILYFHYFLCVNTNSFEIFSQFNVLCLQFSACDYEKGIAARRIHRKVSEFVISSFAFS